MLNIIKIISKYIYRNLLPNKTREFIILNITNSKIDRICNNTEENKIKSILGNDFADYNGKFLFKVEELINIKNDIKLTNKLMLSYFTYFWGIYNNKILCGKLNELPKDMIVVPIRNYKKKYGKIIKSFVKEDERVSLYFIDEFNNEIQYPQTGNNTKTLLIGDKYQLFLSCNPCWDMKEYSNKLNKYLQDNPSILIQLDNGRYEYYQLNNINKIEYINSGLKDYDEMFVFGEII